MKRIIFALGVMLLVFAVAVPAQTQKASVEQELIKLENDWAEAGVKKDIAFLDRIVADDCVVTDEQGNVITKAQQLEAFKSGDFVVTSWVHDELKVRVYGDAAVVTGLSTGNWQYKGKDMSGKYRWTDTFVKRDGRWQCVATHSSRIAEK